MINIYSFSNVALILLLCAEQKNINENLYKSKGQIKMKNGVIKKANTTSINLRCVWSKNAINCHLNKDQIYKYNITGWGFWNALFFSSIEVQWYLAINQ